jgi:16S rRNA (uracil1498-N3)-methyltransferase
MVRIFYMNWILLNTSEVVDGCARLTDGRAKHIIKVLRAEVGKKLRVGLLDGPFGTATVVEVSSEHVLLDCVFEAARPARPKIDLLLAMPRPKVLKRLWSQFAALGVGRIIITNAEKVERYYFDTHILTPEFYTPRLVEGLQQAGDTRLPAVEIVRNLQSFLGEEPFADVGHRLLADPSGTQSVQDCLTDIPVVEGAASRVLLGIGPEGGWTPAELELFRAHRFELFWLGPRILRTDTASIALLGSISEILRCNTC